MIDQRAENPDNFSVAIIGGGIAGLCLAIGLKKYPNIDFQIYEAAHEFGEVGLGVNISPNANRALSMISPETKAAFEAEATGNQWDSHADVFTTYVVGIKGPEENKKFLIQRNSIGARAVHRARFLKRLVQNIPRDRAHFNKSLVSLEQGDSKVKLHFKDGSTAEHDCVVGADGIHSVCRAHLLGADNPAANPRYAGAVCFRALIPMAQAMEKLGAEYAQNCHLLCGTGAAIFSYPVAHGNFLNIIMIDFNHAEWTADKWIVPSSRAELLKVLDGWGDTAMAIVDLMASNDLNAWAMHDHKDAETYARRRVSIVGDAAHATTPFQGQGAGQAIEDALTLSTLLGNVANLSQIRPAFAGYDLARRARSQKVVSTSRLSGQVLGMMAKEPGMDTAKMAKELTYMYSWLWNRDLEDQNQEALKLFFEAKTESEKLTES